MMINQNFPSCAERNWHCRSKRNSVCLMNMSFVWREGRNFHENGFFLLHILSVYYDVSLLSSSTSIGMSQVSDERRSRFSALVRGN